MQVWDFWVVTLAMDTILGLPWLRGVQPAIDWQALHVLWEHKGDVIWVFGRRALPTDVVTAVLGTS